MTTIDERGRAAAAAARDDAMKLAEERVEQGLRNIHDGTQARGRRRGRWIALGVAASCAAAAVVVVAIVALHDPTPARQVLSAQTEPPDATSVARAVTTTTTTRDTVPTATGQTQTSATTSVTTVATTSPPPASNPVLAPIAVRADALPPALNPTPWFTLPWTSADRPEIAGGLDNDVVVVDPDAKTATILLALFPPSPGQPSPSGAAKPTVVPLSIALYDPLIGPDMLLYGFDPIAATIVAIPLGGPQAGQVIASTPIDLNLVVEAPMGIFGLGHTGIIDRRTGDQVAPYAAWNGTVATDPAPHAVTSTSDSEHDLVVHDPDGSYDWHLTVARDPAWPGEYTGPVPAMPSSNSGAIWWTTVGPSTSADDVENASEPVLAVLNRDGTGNWYSLVNGWEVASSDVSGTWLMQIGDTSVQLSRIDPQQRLDFLEQPATPNQRPQFALTLPTDLTSATPCTASDLALDPSDDGAMGAMIGTVLLHNVSDHACQLQGVPLVELLAADGTVVQSTDPKLQTDTGTPILLVPDSWASLLLGALGASCGGNKSGVLRLVLSGTTASVPFDVGRDYNPELCDPAMQLPAKPDQLPVEPFQATQPYEGQDGLAGATVTIDAPATVRAGDVLQYDVVVSVHANVAALGPGNCPIFEQTLATASGQFLLNCDDVVVYAGEPARFHMRLQIPAGAPAGPATLTWQTTEPTGHEATATVTITD